MRKLGQPNYKKIYSDIINKKYPFKMEKCSSLLSKKVLSVIDIVELNRRVFGTNLETTSRQNQRLRSYTQSDIMQILDYQKKNGLNNSQVSRHFNLSRNTIAKWKKLF